MIKFKFVINSIFYITVFPKQTKKLKHPHKKGQPYERVISET